MSRTTFDLTRRAAVKAIVAGSAAAASIISAAAAPQPDPVFAAIEAHRSAVAADCEITARLSAAQSIAFALPRGSAERDARLDATETISQEQDRAFAESDRLAYVLADTRPTTLAGCAAVLRYATAFNDEGHLWPDQGEHNEDDGAALASWECRLRVTLAAALDAIAEKGAQS